MVGPPLPCTAGPRPLPALVAAGAGPDAVEEPDCGRSMDELDPEADADARAGAVPVDLLVADNGWPPVGRRFGFLDRDGCAVPGWAALCDDSEIVEGPTRGVSREGPFIRDGAGEGEMVCRPAGRRERIEAGAGARVGLRQVGLRR